MAKHKTKTTPEMSTSIADLYADAEARMEMAGLKRRDLSPEVAILALNDAATVSRALEADWQQRMSEWSAEFRLGHGASVMERVDDKPTHRRAQHLDNVRYELSRSSRRRTILAGLALGALAGGGFLYTVGKSKAEFEKSFYTSGERVTLIGDPVMEGNNLVQDHSIMPGDTWHDTPVVGPVVRNIPGIPDFGGTKVERTVTEYVPGTERQESVSEGYTADRSENPVAPDLTLTGVEYAQGREAAKRFIDKLENDPGFTEESIIVRGEVSDEYNGALGVGDPEQVKLGEARADVALQALRDEAAERGYALPANIVAVPAEHVLSRPEVEEIKGMANLLGVPLADLLGMYNTGANLPDDVEKKLDEKLAEHRGADFTAVGIRRSTHEVQKLIPAEGDQERFYDDIPGEGVFVFAMLAPSVYGLGFSALGKRGRAVRRKARRKAKKAGLPLD